MKPSTLLNLVLAIALAVAVVALCRKNQSKEENITKEETANNIIENDKMKEIDYKDLKINPFDLIGKEWMLITAGNETDGCNTMTASWGAIGCIWGDNDPSAVIFIRPSRYTKTFVDKEEKFTLCVLDSTYRDKLLYLGSTSGRDEDKIKKAGLTPIYEEGTTYFAEAKLVLICRKMFAQPLSESSFFYAKTIEENYPARDFHTMYVGKIERILVRDNEYLDR